MVCVRLLGWLLVSVFEKLDRAFVLLGLFPGAEGPEVPALAGLWVDLPRVEAELARGESANHSCLLFSGAVFEARYAGALGIGHTPALVLPYAKRVPRADAPTTTVGPTFKLISGLQSPALHRFGTHAW